MKVSQTAGRVALLGRPLRVGAWLLLFPLLAMLPRSAQAGLVSGEVVGWEEGMDCEVWLVGNLNLTGVPPLAVSTVEDGAFKLGTGSAPGEGWLFLRQRGRSEDGGPYQLFMPLSLEPFDLATPPRRVQLKAASPELASLRETGDPMPDWWLVPSLLTLLIFGLGALVRMGIRWRIEMATGAKALVAVLDGGSDGKVTPTTPLATDFRVAPMARNRNARPPDRAERRAIGLILGIATLLRLPRLFGTSFDLLEHTYGPGSVAIGDGRSLVEFLFIQPSAVEVTHPPLYHWLLMVLGFLGPHEWVLRAPGFVASVTTVFLLWRLFRRFHKSTGLAAAGGLAVAAPAIHFGADATPYAFVGLVLVASLVLLLRALERGSAAAWRAWLGLLALGFLCHYITALFGLAQIGAVAILCLLRYRSVAWLGALHRALGAGLLLAPLPLAWAFVHFAWFAPVALDTRLFADTYPKDPGLAAFFSQFVAVATGVSPDRPIIATTLVLLALLGLYRWYTLNRPVALVVLATLSSFVFGTIFLYFSLIEVFGNHIFWGFRWVSWIQPLLIGLGALALFPRQAKPLLRATTTGLGVVWIFAALHFTATLTDHTRRPDHAGAAAFLSQHLEDRDSITPLPMWAHRGPVTSYLTTEIDGVFGEHRGVMSWNFSGRSVFLESTFEGLPFEGSAINSHIERLWLLNIDERMFGRSKFSPTTAARAIAWADRHLEATPIQAEFDNLSLQLYRRPEGVLRWDGNRTMRLTAPELDITSVPWLEPNMAGCDRARDDQEPHWRLNVRIPVHPSLGEVTPRVTHASWLPTTDPGHLSGTLLGGPCAGPAPEFVLDPERTPPPQFPAAAEERGP